MNESLNLNNAILEISWKAIKTNLTFFRSKINPSTKLMLMIKASAYGNGAIEIANRIEKTNSCDYLGVAYPNEGIELRKSGIELPILVLNPSPDSWDALLEHSLEPEIHNLESLNSFSIFLKSKITKLKKAYPIHLKFNTGMNRLGIEENELDQLVEMIQDEKLIQVKSIMTHLSSAALENEDKYTLNQLKKFDDIINQLSPFLPKDILTHALNSHAAERFPEFQYNMIRVGIGMYGASNLLSLKKELLPVCKLKTTVSAIRKVKKGDSISYSRSGLAPKEGFVATLAIGYADGFNRNLGNGNWEVEINNQLYPTIGNICMDLSMVFLEESKIKIGEEATIFGGLKDIHDFAEAQHTISYEAMTNIGTRVKRVIVD